MKIIITNNEKIIKDHKKKSYQVKKLRKFLKYTKNNSINKNELIKKLQMELINEESRKICDYYIDEKEYIFELGKQQGKINLLEKLIGFIENKDI